jgi:hypothetical protein
MFEKLNFSPQQITEVIKKVNIWWGFSFKGLKFELSILRTQDLYKSGLCILGDLWKAKIKDFHSQYELKILFLLEEKGI